MSDLPRYNRPCRNEKCGGGGWGRRKRRSNDVVCRVCYHRLPDDLRNGLWSRYSDGPGDHAGRITLALEWLDENPE